MTNIFSKGSTSAKAAAVILSTLLLLLMFPRTAFAAAPTDNTPSDPTMAVSPLVSDFGAPVTFTVEQQIGTTPPGGKNYAAFELSAKLDKRAFVSVNAAGATAYKVDGTVVTPMASSDGTFQYDSNTGKLTYTLASPYLAANAPDGETYRIVFEATPSTDLEVLKAFKNATGTAYVIKSTAASSVKTSGETESYLKTSNEAVLTVNIPLLSVEKTSSVSDANVGQTIHYIVETTQVASKAKAIGVNISDTLPIDKADAGASISFASIKVFDNGGTDITSSVNISTVGKYKFNVITGKNLNQNEKITIEYDVMLGTHTSSGLVGQDLVNTASASASNADETNVTNVVSIASPKFKTASIEAAPTTVNVGDNVNYTIKMQEGAGAAILYNAKFSATFDEALAQQNIGIDMNSLVIKNNAGDNITGSCTITPKKAANDKVYGFDVVTGENLAANEMIVAVYSLKAADSKSLALNGSTISTTAVFGGDNYISKPAPSSTAVVNIATPSLSVTKSAGSTTPSAGDTVTYTVNATQTSTNGVAKNVSLTDTIVIPENADAVDPFLKANVQLNGVDITKDVTVKIENRVLTVTTDKNLSKDETLSVTYDVRFGNDDSIELNGKTIVNTVVATSDNVAPTAPKTVSAVVQTPNVTMSKTSDKEVINTGDSYSYTLSVKQASADAVAKNVSVIDSLDSSSYDKGMFIDGRTVKIMKGEEDITDSLNVTFTGSKNNASAFKISAKDGGKFEMSGITDLTVTYTVTAGQATNDKLRGVVVSNAADISGSNFASPKTAVVKVTVASAKLELTKTSDKDSIVKGDKPVYTVTVKNTDANASSIAKNIEIIDSLSNSAADLGYKIVSTSLKLTDENGTDLIQDADVSWDSASKFTMATNANVASGKTLTLTYECTTESIPDDAFSNTLTNSILADADNASYATATRDVMYSGKAVPDPVTEPGGSLTDKSGANGGGSGNDADKSALAAMGDVLPYVIGAAVVAAGVLAGVLTWRKTRRK